jgi:ABC-2 type transport system permease protein
VDVNPVSHLVTAVRSLMAGNADTTEIVWVLIASVVLTAVLGPIAMRIYRTRT